MSTTEHSSLTGASLHEPKGVASASSSTVYVADGLGSGTWETVPLAALASTAKAFQAQLLHVRDQVTSGSAASATSVGSFAARRLQTVVTNEITSASLASNQITLPTGTYWLEAWAGYSQGGSTSCSVKLRLRNITAGTTSVEGQSAHMQAGAGEGMGIVVPVFGRFTLGTSSILELQTYLSSGSGVNGDAITSGDDEVFTDVMIWKIG